MILNFLKTILNSLKRRKQFAALSIFSIAFSIVSITCVATYWGLLHTSLPPEKNKANVRFIIPEVVPNQESLKFLRSPREHKMEFLNRYKDQIAAIGFDEVVPFQHQDGESIYCNQKVFEAELLWATPNLFSVYDFEFIQGHPYRAVETSGPEIPVVISRQFAERVFGTEKCVNEILNFSNVHDNTRLKVVGVIESVGPWSLFFKKDMFLHLNTDVEDYPYNLIVRKKDKTWNALDLELQKLAGEFNQHQEDRLVLITVPYAEGFADLKNMNFLTETAIIIPLLILIVFLPTACIIHLFQSLFNDRLEEMGIRKAMGANSSHIVYQVISESIFIILSAGIISIVVSIPFWNLLLDVPMSVVIKDILNWQVFFYTLLAFIIIGLVIGWLSSLKLARGSIVDYLNVSGG